MSNRWKERSTILLNRNHKYLMISNRFTRLKYVILNTHTQTILKMYRPYWKFNFISNYRSVLKVFSVLYQYCDNSLLKPVHLKNNAVLINQTARVMFILPATDQWFVTGIKKLDCKKLSLKYALLHQPLHAFYILHKYLPAWFLKNSNVETWRPELPNPHLHLLKHTSRCVKNMIWI